MVNDVIGYLSNTSLDLIQDKFKEKQVLKLIKVDIIYVWWNR